MSDRIKFIAKKFLKIGGWLLVSILTLLIIAILGIRTPYVQNKIIQKAIGYLQGKIDTKVTLESIYITFPKNIVLEGLYLEDQKSDTMVYLGSLSVDTDLWALTQNRIEVNSIELSNSTIDLNRNETDSSFNFDYIIQAFNPKGESTDTTSAAWDVIIERVELEKVVVTFDDRQQGNSIKVKVGNLDISLGESKITQSIYKFSDIELNNTSIQISRSYNNSENESDTSQRDLIPFDLDFQAIHLNNISVEYDQPDLNQSLSINLSDLMVESNRIDLNHKLIDLETVSLEHSSISYWDGALDSTADASIKKSGNVITFPATDWIIKLRQLTFVDNILEYGNAKDSLSLFDPNHIEISSFHLLAKDIDVNRNSYKATLEQMSFKERAGFEVKSLKSEIEFSDSRFIVEGFDFETANSKLELNVNATFDLTEGKAIDYTRVKLDVNVKNSFLSANDALFFFPNLIDSLPVKVPIHSVLYIDTRFHGLIADLLVDKLEAKLFDSTVISLSGRVTGLPDFSKSMMDIKLNRFITTRSNMMQVLYDSMVPSSLQIPDHILLTGNFEGTIDASSVRAAMETEVGSIEVNGQYDFRDPATYDIKITSKNLNIGALLKQEQMDTLNMELKITGSGLTRQTLNIMTKIDVSKFKYNGYTYSDFKLDGLFNNSIFEGSASLKDDNLDFTLNADLNYSEKIPQYKATFTLKNADFRALKISERPLKARATLDVNLWVEDFGKVNGSIDVRKVAIYNGEVLYKIDSLLVVSIDQEQESSISIRSDIIAGDFKGTFSLADMPKTIKQHMNRYFSMQDSSIHAFEEPQNFKFNLTLKNSDLFTELIFPQLKSFVPGKIEGEFDSEKNLLEMNIGLTKIKYASSSLDSLLIALKSDNNAFTYMVRLKNLRYDTLHITAVQVQGKLANNHHEANLIILDSLNKEKYRFSATLNSLKNEFKFSLADDNILINYKKWQIPTSNFVSFENTLTRAGDFKLTNGNEQFEMVTSEVDSTLEFRFHQFQLSNFTNLIEGVLPASGLLNGNFRISSSGKENFSSKLNINELFLFERKWGDAAIAMTHTSNMYSIDATVQGEALNLQANGQYENKEPQDELTLQLSLAPFNLELLEPFAFGQLTYVKGTGRGKMEVSSKDSDFSIRGEMLFADATFTSTYLKNSFLLKQERILFNNEGIVFDNFKIADSNANEAIIRGSIKTEDYKNFALNLKASMKRFQLLNTKEGDNELFYGLVKADANAVITGNLNEPSVDLTLALNDDSNFTYIVPESQKSAQELKGVVRFVDRNATLDPFLANLVNEDTIRSSFKGLNLSANLELSDKAMLNIVLDPRTNDKLSVNGNANLVLGIDASGGMDLSGVYEITKGTYNFSFQNLAKREFNLVNGSTIEWTGDPLNATMDISATYKLDASPLDLVYNQINTSNQSEVNSYNQRLPFIVFLEIRGRLLEPHITFKLDMPEEKRNAFGGAIYSKLQDINTRESDLNKQVFSLIILKRFISENPFESQSASSLSNTARQSVSRILSDQLNRLSENIKGVELTFDIKSYENFTGDEVQGETKAQLGISKSLWDERLVVKFAGNLDLEGGNGKQQATDYIGDIALEYKLTSDGRFRIVGFRNSNFDMIDGELTETGTGLIYIKDYNTLRELFKTNKKQ